MNNAGRDIRDAPMSTMSQGDFLHHCTYLHNKKSALKTNLHTQIGNKSFASLGQYEDIPASAVAMDLSLARKAELSSKNCSPMRRAQSTSARPELPFLPNRTDSIASVSSVIPSIPMTPTPVASRYDLRMYPHILEYARIVHLSQREKQKAQARGENVQKWRLPQIPSYQPSASSPSTQLRSAERVDTHAGPVSRQNGGTNLTYGGASNVPQVHQYDTSSASQQIYNDFSMPRSDQQKYDSVLPSTLTCSNSPLGGNTLVTTQTGSTTDLPLFRRGTRLSPMTQNAFTTYPSNQNSIYEKIAPLLQLNQSNNSSDVQRAAIALQLYLQTQQERRRQGVVYDHSHKNAQGSGKRVFQQKIQSNSLKPASAEPAPQLPDAKSSVHFDEDLKTLSPCSSTGEISGSFAPFLNSYDLSQYNASDLLHDTQLLSSNVIDNSLPVYFRIPSTPAGTPECNPASPPTHLAAISSYAVSPNVGTCYQHASPRTTLTGHGRAARINSNNRYITSLGCDAYSQLNPGRSVTNQQLTANALNNVGSALGIGWEDHESQFNKLLGNQQQMQELSHSSKFLPALSDKGNVQQILDQLYCTNGANAQELISKVSAGLYINPASKRPASPMKQYKQLNVSNSFQSAKAPGTSVADQIVSKSENPSLQMIEKLQAANAAACLANVTGNLQNSKSYGNLLHPHDCKPCAFFWTKGCQNGQSCKFCHEWHAPKKKKPMKDQRNLMIIARPDVANYGLLMEYLVE